MVARKTSGQTRSGTGNTHALGESFPRIRTLLYLLYRCPQARLRTFPGGLGNRGNERSGIKMGHQERGVQIALHRPNAALTLMPAF